MKKKTAVVFGTFAPLHQGHIDLIQRAKRQCDQVWVVVSGYEGDRGEQVGLSLQKRFRYIREAFRDDELTSVCKLDETKLPRYPMGWQEWLDQMLAEISYDEKRAMVSISLEEGSPADELRVEIACSLSNNSITERIFDFLNQAELPFDTKEKAYRLVKEEKSIPVLLGRLQALDLENNLYKALCEILTARA